MTDAPKPSTNPLRSQLAGDPDMAELIDLFVEELPKRIDSVVEAWRARELGTLQRLAHQLKGASAGYGFPTIGSAAAKVEDNIRARPPEQVELDQLGANVNQLIDLCRRAAPGFGIGKAA